MFIPSPYSSVLIRILPTQGHPWAFFSAAPLGLGLFLESVFPGLHPLRGFRRRAMLCRPGGAVFLQRIKGYRAGKPRKGRKIIARGFIPWSTRPNFVQAPTGRQKTFVVCQIRTYFSSFSRFFCGKVFPSPYRLSRRPAGRRERLSRSSAFSPECSRDACHIPDAR